MLKQWFKKCLTILTILSTCTLAASAQEHEPPTEVQVSAPARAVVPATNIQTEILKKLKTLFAPDYKDFSPTGKAALAHKLLAQANDSGNDNDTIYSLLMETRRLAVENGDLNLALEVLAKEQQIFEVDALLGAMNLSVEIARKLKNADDHKKFVLYLLSLCDRVAENFDFANVNKLLLLAESSARTANDIPLMKQVTDFKNTTATLQRRYQLVQKSFVALNANAEDPRANLEVGKFYCFDKNRWEQGLPMLAKCDHAAIKSAASAELEAKDNAAALAEAGRLWLTASGAVSGVERGHLMDRASFCLENALPKISGLEKVRYEQDLARIKKERGPIRLFLSDLKPETTEITVGVLGIGKMGFPDKDWPIQLQGIKYERGLATHPSTKVGCRVIYRIGGAYRLFKTRVGICDTAGNEGARSPLTFEILGDGRSLWRSKELQKTGSFEDVVANITGVQLLELKVHCPGEAIFTHAVWADPEVAKQ